MSSINRSYSMSNEDLIAYLTNGQFNQDLERVLCYESLEGVDTDALFTLIRRMEFILPNYESILAESITCHEARFADINKSIRGITQILVPDLVVILQGQRRHKLTETDRIYAYHMLRGLVARYYELRALIVCWLINRISIESAVDELKYTIIVPSHVVS